jgi:2-amino-4-hydroxy-6-hydroxymethyldihydropteridine diphosphokinase
VGGPTDQGAYLNVVVELATAASPRQLLERCARLERDAQRVRGVRFGPRTLDADVLLVGTARVDEPDLVVPHPRLYERRFVLAPLADLAPELVSDEALASAIGSVSNLGTL